MAVLVHVGRQAAERSPTPVAKRGEKTALPPLNLLRLESIESAIEEDELVRLGEVIRLRCAEFGVEGTIEGINPGPVITVFEFQPAPGVKVSQIVSLQDDLALALRAEAVLGYGNASQPGSPHRTDQLELFSTKKLRPVWRTRSEIEEHLSGRTLFRSRVPQVEN